MHPIRLLSLLNPKGVKLDANRGGSVVTPSDVAAALGKLPRFHSALLMWSYVVDDSVAQSIVLPRLDLSLLDLVQGLVMQVWDQEGSPVPGGRSRELAGLLLLEIRSNNVCPTCQGHQYGYSETEGHIECPCCHGTGYKAMSIRARANAVGVNHSTFLHHYRRQYEIAFAFLLGIQQEGLSKLYRQFHGGD